MVENIMELAAADSHELLDETQIESFVVRMAADPVFRRKRVLAIIPDDTRTAPVPLLFRLLNDHLRPRTIQLDWMIALGTHPPLPVDRIARLVGVGEEERERRWPGTRVMNHVWDLPGILTTLGTIPGAEAAGLTGGIIHEDIVVLINDLILDYDLLLVVGPTFPHEVVGFSGGNKYFFPGISGGDMINFTHWLSAQCTIPRTIGFKDTPVRRVLDRAAALIPRRRRCLSLVVTKKGLAGMFYGAPEAAFDKAADLSATRHIVTTDRRYHTILAESPVMYDEIWTAGKCMYKLMSVVEKGGRLIIYAPHITGISRTHGEWMRKVGYHVKDYFLGQWERFAHVPGCILAHSAHVRGLGSYENGVERCDTDVVLATAIPEEECRAVNLGYMDPAMVDPGAYRAREDEGILFVPQAGEYLYRLRADERREA
ncbi:MAG: lactate racemase domain-containing protein [bacterium]|nr:lactate racemase domain-containing protein [bacterium]